MPNTKEEPKKKKAPKREKGFSVFETSLRYLAMLELIPRKPASVSVEEIMQMLDRRNFAINKRSVQRDLNKLAEPFNLDWRQDGNAKNWFYSDKAPVRLFPSMDEHTALSFQLVQAFLQPLMPPETLRSITPWFKKSAERLSQRKEPTARWQKKIHVLPLGLPRQPPTVNPEVQKMIYQAVLDEVPLIVHYRGRNSERFKEYVITPLGIVIRDYVSYVVGTVNDDPLIRQFALHRFKDAERENVAYFRPAGFDLAAYAKENFGFKEKGASPTLDLKMRLDKDAAKGVDDCPVNNRQELAEQADGSFLLSATVPNTLELRRWIQSFGQQVEVLKPDKLRNDIAAEIAAMSKRYQKKIA